MPTASSAPENCSHRSTRTLSHIQTETPVGLEHNIHSLVTLVNKCPIACLGTSTVAHGSDFIYSGVQLGGGRPLEFKHETGVERDFQTYETWLLVCFFS